MKLEDLKKRIDELINLANEVHSTKQQGHHNSWVNSELFNELKSASLSFIKSTYSYEHPYYKEFESNMVFATPGNTERGRGILKAVKKEIDGGWLCTIKGLVSAEIFADFLEMGGIPAE